MIIYVLYGNKNNNNAKKEYKYFSKNIEICITIMTRMRIKKK